MSEKRAEKLRMFVTVFARQGFLRRKLKKSILNEQNMFCWGIWWLVTRGPSATMAAPKDNTEKFRAAQLPNWHISNQCSCSLVCAFFLSGGLLTVCKNSFLDFLCESLNVWRTISHSGPTRNQKTCTAVSWWCNPDNRPRRPSGTHFAIRVMLVKVPLCQRARSLLVCCGNSDARCTNKSEQTLEIPLASVSWLLIDKRVLEQVQFSDTCVFRCRRSHPLRVTSSTGWQDN